MGISPIISLISVSIATITIFILGFVVFFSNRKSATNKAFLFFSATTIIWSFLNYLSYQVNSPDSVLWILRLVMFSAIWQAFSVFTLFYVSPQDKMQFSKLYKFFVIPLVIIVSAITLTSLVFKEIAEMSPFGGALRVENGPGIAFFGLLSVGLVSSGFFILIRKIIKKEGAERTQLVFLLVGALIFFISLILFNFILPAFFDNPRFIPLSALFAFPFIAFTSYAILKHGLFNVKVIATELLVFAIWIVVLIQLLMANSLNERLLGGGLLLCVIIFGIFLIRSVKHEVRQREELEELSHELKHANEELKQLDKAKSEFVSIASHQLRTPLSITKGYVSMILEGIYGDPSDKVKDILQKVYVTNEGLIALVNNLLDLSRMEAGTLKYEFTKVSFEKMVDEIVIELELEAKHRDLYLTWTSPKEPLPLINADSVKFKQVIEILIENSLKYTQKGGVSVSLEKENSSLLLKIKDTGIGIDPHEIEHLFNKFGRGEEGSKVNAGGIGLGLYTAKQIVLAHGGEIWVESKGRGKGSTFCVRLLIDYTHDKPLDHAQGKQISK